MESDKTNNPAAAKIYIGNAKVKVRRSGDQFLVGHVCLDDLNDVPEEYIRRGKNKKRYVKIILNPYKSGPNEHNNTHSISVDTYRQSNNEEIQE